MNGQEEDRRMDEEGLQDSAMPAGEEANGEPRKEDGGHGHGSSLYQSHPIRMDLLVSHPIRM